MFNFFKRKVKVIEEKKETERELTSIFDIDLPASSYTGKMGNLEEQAKLVFQRTAKNFKPSTPNAAMDAAVTNFQNNSNFSGPMVISNIVFDWYVSQSFIGYQVCALIAQHWLVQKACEEPAKDATRKGFEITVNDGTPIEPKILDAIREYDKSYKLTEQLVEFVTQGRVFGIRIAMFIIDNKDPQFYENPFNIDGVMPGSYKGISQIDPYWLTPELDMDAASNPASPDFYVPTWWRVNGKRYHKSHLIIIKGTEVADILKPTYFYGGISVPQKIYSRVYASERTADEAPQLVLTKRSTILSLDVAAFAANPTKAQERLMTWVQFRDNYAIKAVGKGENIQQFDTSLADLDSVIMTQFQLVAAIAQVPATKLMGTPPKGFNSTGEFEEANYHQQLETIQTHDLTPFVERHHMLLIKSEIAPKFNIAPFQTAIKWNALDAMTAKEQAEVKEIDSRTDQNYVNTGAISNTEVRKKLVNDPNSGYNGLSEEIPQDEQETENLENEQLLENYLETEAVENV